MNASGLTRRHLMKGAAGAFAAPLVVPSSLFGAEAPGNKVCIGHIGVGGRGSALLRGFQRVKTCQSVAFADPFQKRREGWADKLSGKAYADFRELLARKDIDGVVIATPDHWHVPAALHAVRAGKDVYVEKPLGISVLHDQTIRREIVERKRIFQYGTQQRSSKHCRLGCELVRNGAIGKVKQIDVWAPNGRGGGSTDPIDVPPGLDYDMWLGPAPKVPYTKDRCTNLGAYHIYDYAIGFIAGWGAHPLDILLWGYDVSRAGVTEVEGTGKIPTEGLFNTVMNWDVTYRFANGLVVTLKPGGNDTHFVGEKGTIKVSRGRLDADPKDLLKTTLGADAVRLPVSSHHQGNFVDCIKTRKEAVSDIRDAVRSDILSHLGDIAIRLKRKIRWDWEKEEILGDAEASKMLSRPLRAPWTL